MSGAAQRLSEVRARLAKAARLAGRDPGDITLIAVSKTQGPEAIAELIAAGQRDFGENRLQEAQGKFPAIRAEHPDLRLHFLGRLQSNKAAGAVELCDVIHSLDRESLAQALAAAMETSGRRLPSYIQVNIGEEPQKGGCAPGAIGDLTRSARGLGLEIAGLMAIPPEGREAAPYFALLARLADLHGLKGLSIGMSADYETAAMIGATDVRIGTALFGPR